MNYGIHWFRRDLRLVGNPALTWNVQKHKGKVLGVFCFDKKFLSRSDFSANRFQFFLDSLKELQREIVELGGDLLFLDIGPMDAFEKLLTQLPSPPSAISWNRDYEPFATDRDKKLGAFLEQRGIATHTDRDHLLIEPHEIFKGDNPKDGYQVYTPFSKRWLDIAEGSTIQSRILFAKKRTEIGFSLSWKALTGKDWPDVLSAYQIENSKRVNIRIPKAGAKHAFARLKEFKNIISRYPTDRDIPSVPGTSQLSPYLKNGSITIADQIAELGLGNKKYVNELIWREFYYHILARNPRVEHTAFLEKYADIKWENREDWFEAWKEGMTGFPIVDAGMRQLNTTGWMHNRVRMIVASFLTKDLLIDWRWGERYFMEKLLDGDLAPNNGGWQWAASTGCDPQPYFRIFNPLLQSQKFDPEGKYIRRFVPELADLSSKDIHEPPHLLRGEYPQPIVEHAIQREKALSLYEAVSRK